MDATTEPIVAVVGYPIAGNPTQFALETGLEAAGIDCRIFSINLSPDSTADALIGMAAMNFAGVWVARSSMAPVQKWLAEDLDQASSVDFLIPPCGKSAKQPRDWKTFKLKAEAWPKLVATHLAVSDYSLKKVILAGGPNSRIQVLSTGKKGSGKQETGQEGNAEVAVNETAIEGKPGSTASLGIQAAFLKECQAQLGKVFGELTESDVEPFRRLPTHAEITNRLNELADDEGVLVVLGPDADRTAWNASMNSIPRRTVVVDLNGAWEPMDVAHAEHLKASSDGHLIRSLDIHAQCLSSLVKQLFESTVAAEVFQEAIDEYLAV
ncbi:hypothetical protein SAMN06265222_106134 [Neorhodopirellula lusitana]|uniref:Shikimate 5-dehydrogenase n=1 Tax=Neorhodopirellula lusitana TaxID=445327 RepID=A0ABY1Q655_9BACT|nr:hypothetical protein [Neorhodopirellula lusitana]SMP58851.1 hypothetical protein SAMN06265222_106134 [Neorhodopirellula lusitana]